jgi:hypothetical protein
LRAWRQRYQNEAALSNGVGAVAAVGIAAVKLLAVRPRTRYAIVFVQARIFNAKEANSRSATDS